MYSVAIASVQGSAINPANRRKLKPLALKANRFVRFDTGNSNEPVFDRWVHAYICGRARTPNRAAVAKTTGVNNTTVASRLNTAVTSEAATNTAANNRSGRPFAARAIHPPHQAEKTLTGTQLRQHQHRRQKPNNRRQTASSARTSASEIAPTPTTIAPRARRPRPRANQTDASPPTPAPLPTRRRSTPPSPARPEDRLPPTRRFSNRSARRTSVAALAIGSSYRDRGARQAQAHRPPRHTVADPSDVRVPVPLSIMASPTGRLFECRGASRTQDQHGKCLRVFTTALTEPIGRVRDERCRNPHLRVASLTPRIERRELGRSASSILIAYQPIPQHWRPPWQLRP